MSGEFWLSDSQWSAIEPLLPKKGSGAHRVDDRRVLSGIIHVLKSGCRWRDTPSVYGPPTTIYNRYHRWAARGLWQGLFRALVTVSPDGIQMIDSTTAKAHRSAAGGKGGPRRRRLAARGADAQRKSMLQQMVAGDLSPSK